MQRNSNTSCSNDLLTQNFLRQFGFNGKENDNEVKGDGNSVDFGARIYDPRLGRFLSLDPKIKEFPQLSPYCFAANRPISHIDKEGEGPEDRIKAARNMIGTQYFQEKETSSHLRTGSTNEALKFMDCSELVCRVLKADQITPKVELKSATDLKGFLDDGSKFEHSDNIPKVGDIAVWEGHVGIVSAVDKDGKFKLIHAAGKGKLANENKYAIKANQYRDSKFYGFYRPKVETKENKDVSSGTKPDPKNPSNAASSSKPVAKKD